MLVSSCDGLVHNPSPLFSALPAILMPFIVLDKNELMCHISAEVAGTTVLVYLLPASSNVTHYRNGQLGGKTLAVSCVTA